MLSITKVGNVTETRDTKEYELPLQDINGKSWNIKVYGINEITSDISKVDISQAIRLFDKFQLEHTRPSGKVNLLWGLDCCQLLPDKVAEVENLQLMYGPLGYCIRGSHPSIKFHDNTQSNIVQMDVYFTTIGYTTINDDINKYFNIENLGTVPPSAKCTDCNRNLNPDITIREEREIRMIKKGLNYDPTQCKWTATYPWIKDPMKLPNNCNSKKVS